MVLLVVDTQKLITNEKLYQFKKFVINVEVLINEARKNNIEVIYVCHDDGIGSNLTKGNTEFEIYEKFQPINQEKIFYKYVNSPFRDTDLLEYLKKKNKKNIITVGLQTEYCIDATIKCGFEHGFNMIVPEYSNTTIDNKFISAKQSYHYYNEFIWDGRYANCLSIDETIKLIKQYNFNLLVK